MSGLLALEREHAINPLDILEQIIAANEWSFERRSDGEMAAEAPGKWCDYGLYFSWSSEISAMHFSCAFDLKVPPEGRAKLFELLALANEKLWIGHFELWSSTNVLLFRHAAMIDGDADGEGEGTMSLAAAELLIESAVEECERFYPVFQFVLWGGKSPKEALAAALVETQGEA
jgi:hypothetical protein